MLKNSKVAALVVVVAALANNAVYLQDLWFGQGYMSFDSWKPYAAVAVCLLLIAAGVANLLRAAGR